MSTTDEAFEAGVIDAYAKEVRNRYFGPTEPKWEHMSEQSKGPWINAVRPLIETMRARERMVEELAAIVGLADGETYRDVPAKVRTIMARSAT